MKETRKNKPIVTYVGLSDYYRQYYMVKYGSEFACFPKENALSTILHLYLVENPSLKLISEFSYNEVAFNYDRDGKIFDIDICLPRPEDKDKFLAVAIPEVIERGGKKIETNGFFQLNRPGTTAFRQQIKVEFWLDCLLFVDECALRAKAKGITPNKESAISDFMLIYDIPMAWFDTLLRYESRWRNQLCDKIEKKRDEMENLSGRCFLYT